MHARFYAPGAGTSGEIVALSLDESVHLTRVLRLKRGDAVRAFDGRGREFEAVVEDASPREAQLRLGPVRTPLPERRTAVTLVQAVLKGDKMDDVVRDATMMGIAAIQPVLAARSETTLEALVRGRRQDRWERVAIASVKQCGRAVMPRVLSARPLIEVLGFLAASRDDPVAFMFVEPDGTTVRDSFQQLSSVRPQAAAVVVGPEGGWTADEVARGGDACRLVTLGGPTLRADAMSIVALTALFARWGEL